ncbi:MAG: hypothetical protein IPG96_07590 [Proteobacteria bacterium]|nr:hypothetical protein [Pseudomonadota bacterium]
MGLDRWTCDCGSRRSGRRSTSRWCSIAGVDGGAAKLEQAKRAAIQALEGLGPEDIVSVVAYDTTVEVLRRRPSSAICAAVYRQIEQLRARGTTALFAGVSAGAHEPLKFLSGRGVNRGILLGWTGQRRSELARARCLGTWLGWKNGITGSA